MAQRSAAVLAALATLVLNACDGDAEVEAEEVVRAIKTITIAQEANGQVREFAGTVVAADVSTLSFQVSGTVATVEVSLGDQVRQGQPLATLDREPFAIRLREARANRDAQKATREEARLDLERKQKLFERGNVARAAVEKSESTYQTTREAVAVLASKVELARRDYNNTILAAPFAGVVAARMVDPFVEIRSGEPVFEIEAAGDFEVTLNVPEGLIERLSVGQPVDIELPSVGEQTFLGFVSEIGSRAEEANAFPVRALIADPTANVRSGMTASVRFIFQSDSDDVAYLLPVTAVLPIAAEKGGGSGSSPPTRANVFVFDEAAGVVRLREIQARNLRDNFAEVTDGVEPGDIVAVAGVHHLHDGQRVKLLP